MKFKYQVFIYPKFAEKVRTTEKVEAYLNECGQEGWELVKMELMGPIKLGHYRFIFKKRIEEE